MKLEAFKAWLNSAKDAAKGSGSAVYLENINRILNEEDFEEKAEFYVKKILKELYNLINSKNKPINIAPSPGQIYEKLNPEKYLSKKNQDYIELINDIKGNAERERKKKSQLIADTISQLSFHTPIEQVITKIKEMKLDNKFKQQLYWYQIRHAKEVYEAQLKLTPKPEVQSPGSSKKSDKEKQLQREITIAFNFAKNIQFLICMTKWKVGIFGGTDIYDRKGHLINTVPQNMVKMMEIIDNAYKEDPTGKEEVWIDAFRKLAEVGTKAARKPSKGLFSGKRDTATQAFYDRFVTSLIQVNWETPKKSTPTKRSPS